MASLPDDNPNTQDVPESQQVMRRPNVAALQNGEADRRPLVMNGVPPPLRGNQDMDGEVLAPVSTQAGRAERTAGVMNREAAMQASAANPTSFSGAEVGPSTSKASPSQPTATTSPPTRGQSGVRDFQPVPPDGAQGGPQAGMLSGVLRVVQTLPGAVENLVARSTAGRSNPGTPGQHDSVEYASVRSSSDRLPPAPPPEVPPQAPLFDVPTLVRLQQLQENAPLLYPVPSPEFSNYRPASEPIDQRLSVDRDAPRPPSTSSSELQAEVRRQLNEILATRDEESRRLRAQVEALSMENHSLRMRAVLMPPLRCTPPGSLQGFRG